MTEQVHVARADALVQDALELLIKHDISCVPVTLGQGPIGMVTERDILSRVIVLGLNPKKIRVKEIMSTPLILGTMSMSIEEAARRMNENNIRRLVIVDDKGNIEGLVTITDIIRLMAGQDDALQYVHQYLPK